MRGEIYEVEYFSDGFFGYGDDGDFKPWGIAHILMLIVMVVGIVLLAVFGPGVKEPADEKLLRCGLFCSMLLCEFGYFWRLSYVGPGTHERKSMIMFLPLQACEWTLLFAVLMLFMPSELLFSMVFYLTLSCGLVPLIFPAAISTTGPRYFRFYQFWGEHILPIWSTFYMMFVHGFRPHPIGILLEFVMLAVMLPAVLYFNSHFEDCDYFYLKPEKYTMLKMFVRDTTMSRMILFYGAVIVVLCLATHAVYCGIIFLTGGTV